MSDNKKSCPDCKGTGKIGCPVCNTSEKGINEEIGTPRIASCPLCNGTGKIECPHCRGTGSK